MDLIRPVVEYASIIGPLSYQCCIDPLWICSETVLTIWATSHAGGHPMDADWLICHRYESVDLV